MNYSELEKHLSEPRLKRYLNVSSGDHEKALAYYNSSLELAQAFLPVLHLFEVGFRNAIHKAMVPQFGANWITNLTSSELGEIAGVTTNLAKEVITIKERLRRQAKPGTEAQYISETTFGFWAEIFYRDYDSEIGNIPLNAYKNRKLGYTRIDAYNDLITIKDLRNRISHHDCLFITLGPDGKNDLLVPKKVARVRSTLYDILSQVDIDLKNLVKGYDTILPVLDRISKI